LFREYSSSETRRPILDKLTLYGDDGGAILVQATLAMNATIHAAEWFGDKYGKFKSLKSTLQRTHLAQAGLTMNAPIHATEWFGDKYGLMVLLVMPLSDQASTILDQRPTGEF
jgi:hypothetical protein